jgi:methyl-accepting chemotaxis protein
MADWVTTVSKYQTANLLTPLPATSNWTSLVPLDANGNALPTDEYGNVPPEYGMRPYHLYTGRQLVYQDERWSMAESRELFDAYQARLNLVDTLYERIFRLLRSPRFRLGSTAAELSGTMAARINEFSEVLRTLSDSSKELPDAIGTRMQEVSDALGQYGAQLSATGKELPEVMSQRINDASEVLRKHRLQIAQTGRELSETVSSRINEVGEALNRLSALSREPANPA